MYRIRKCTEADLLSIVELSKAWIEEDVTIGYENVIHSVESLKIRTGDYFLVLEHRDQIVGYTFGEIKLNPTPVFKSDPRYLEIYEIYIAPEHRDQGQGQFMIQAVKSEAEKQEIKNFLVGSSNKNWHRTVKFYESLGFNMWYVQMYASKETESISEEQSV